jgi:hypothetical protein
MRSRSWNQDNFTEWAIVKIPSVSFEYCTVEDHSKEIMMFKVRFRKAQTFSGYSKNTSCHSCLKKPSSGKSVFRSKFVRHHTFKLKSIRWKTLEDL